jgi:hypothetical protein
VAGVNPYRAPGGWRRFGSLVIDRGARGHTQGGDAADYDTDTYDTAGDVYAGGEPTWIPLDQCEIEAASWRRGRDSILDGFAPGTALIRLVYVGAPGDGWAWRQAISVGDEIRLRVAVAGRIWPLWRGDVTDLADEWTPAGTGAPAELVAVTIQAADILARLGAVDMLERPPEGADDTADARIRRIAGFAQIPPERLNLDPSGVRLVASNFAQNLAGELAATVLSEGGDCWGDVDGALRFRARQWWSTDPRSQTPQITWTNIPAELTHPDTYSPAGFGARANLDRVHNRVTLARGDDLVSTASDTTSQSLYGLRVYQFRNMYTRDRDDLDAITAWRLAEAANRTRIVDAITAGPILTGTQLDAQCDVRIGDRHRILWDDGDTITDLAVWVQAVNHEVTADQWVATFGLDERWGFQTLTGYDGETAADGYNVGTYAA